MSGKLEFGEEDDQFASLPNVWDLCLHLLATKVPVVTFETHIRPIKPVSYENSVVTLGVANSFARDWLEKRWTNAIRSALEFHLDTTGLQVQFVVMAREAQGSVVPRKTDSGSRAIQDAQPSLPLEEIPEIDVSIVGVPVGSNTPPLTLTRPSGPARPAARKNDGRSDNASLPLPSLPLNERLVFSHFLVGRSNRMAHAGAVRVAAQPGEVYNPLFLYGAPGLGKTHLLQAVAHEIRRLRPQARVAYVSGEYFAQHYITSLRNHDTETFRRQYRQVDVWLVDDIQFIASKEHTKEEFFYTFNTLYQSGKQIVIASDRSPRELNTMDERLRSRFQSGLIADIGPPELETRIAILQRCRERENARISDDVLDYIASAIQSNIRALEGAITKLIATSSIMKLPITTDMAHDALGEYFIARPVRIRRLSLEEIVTAVAEHFGTTSAAIIGTSRNKDISLARHITMYLIRELMPEINTRIVGAQLGGRDHSSIVHAAQKIRALADVDSDLAALLKELSQKLSV